MSLTKQVLGGTTTIAAAGIAARLISIVTVPYLTPRLGPEPYGVAALVATVVSLAVPLAILGMDSAYGRFFLQGDVDQRDALERFCWRLAAGGAAIAAVVAAAGWAAFGARWVSEPGSIGLYSAVAIVFGVGVMMGTARARLLGNYGRIAASLFIAAAVTSGISVGLAFAGWRDAWTLLLGTLAGSVTTLMVLGPLLRFRLLAKLDLPASVRRSVVTFGAVTAVSAPMYWVISSADRWFIGWYASTSEIGVYSMAASLATVGLMLNASLVLTWFPEASRVYGQKGPAALESLGILWARMVAALAVVWLAVTAAGGDILRLLAAPAFHPGARYIPWLAGGVFLYGLATLANTALYLEAKMRQAATMWTGGAMLCVALNYLLVPRMGAIGAAIAQCASFGAIVLGVMTASHRILPTPVPVKRLGLTLAAVFVAGLILNPAWNQSPLWSLGFKLPVGLACAWIVLRVIAPDWHRRILNAATGWRARQGT